MLGTALATRGGVSSVARTYLESGLFARWDVAYLPTHGSGSFVRKLCIAATAALSFSARLAFRRPALVHIHVASNASFWRKLVFFVLARASRVPVVLHIHGGGFERFYESGDPRFTQPLVRWMLTRSAQVFALSERWRGFFCRIAPAARVTVLPNPVAPPRHTAREPIAGRIVFLGRLSHEKGVFDLLNALARIATAHPAARLLLGGEGNAGAVRRELRTLGLDGRVELLGWVDGDAKDRLLAGASVFALPSFVEGMPVCVLEAMTHGVPVVVSDAGGMPDMVGHGVEGLVVPAGDVDALAEALTRLLDDPALARAMGERGRARAAREFEAPQVCRQLEQAYTRIIGAERTSCSTA